MMKQKQCWMKGWLQATNSKCKETRAGVMSS